MENRFELRSFGRRRGRKLSDRQEALKRDLLPRVALDLSLPCDLFVPEPPEADGTQHGNRRLQPIWLEIGFGGGEHLLWQAVRHPHVTFIACEPFEDGVVKVLSRIEDEGIRNIRLHMGDARDVLRWLPDASVVRVFILYPDPWPKKKHRKRRLVNAATLGLLYRVLRPGAELRIATDIGDYARTMLAAFREVPGFAWQADGPRDWRLRPPDWPETRYEQKAAREGRRSYYFRFTKS